MPADNIEFHTDAPLADERLEQFIQRVPKAELHLHLEGAFRWETVRELHSGGSHLSESPPWLATGRRFGGFDEFREVFRQYLLPATGTREAVERHTYEVLTDLAGQQVRYAEIITGPLFHMRRGLSLEAVLAAMQKAQRAAKSDHGIESRFILGLNRQQSQAEAEQMFYEAIEIGGPKGSGLFAGVDLQGDERVGRVQDYARAFEFAREQGMRLKAHAGELCGAESVRSTLEVLGVEHLSHGVRSAEDPELVREIAARGIYLHVCPTSNVLLGVAESYGEHPLQALHAAGCRVTINSDDPLLFGTTLTKEYRHAVRDMGCTGAELARMIKTAFESSLLEESARRILMAEVADEAATLQSLA